MAFSFFGFKKNKEESIQPHQYAIKDLQTFLLQKLASFSRSDVNSWVLAGFKREYKEYINNVLPNDKIWSISEKLNGLLLHSNGTYANYLIESKYVAGNHNIEEFYNSFGKEALDELMLAFKAYFDKDLMYSIYESGKWLFPAHYIYEECIEAGITSIHSDFSKQKAIKIATENLTARKVPAQYHSIYVNDATIADLLRRGEAEHKKITKMVEEWHKTEEQKPKRGKLSEAEYRYISLTQRLLSLYGIDKRICMLDDAIENISKKISDYIEGQKAIKELSFILSSSVKQEKKKDWAFLGGLADGIAGPGAGVSVAANAIVENIEIEKRNTQARQAANQTIRSLYAGASNLSTDISDLENEKKLMQYHLRDAGTKVVMEQYATDEIFTKLEITSKVTKRKDGNGLDVTVMIKNNFKADAPENVKIAVDGTLSAKVFFEDTLLDTICVPLPLFGVSEKESVTAYTDYYVEAEGNYSVEFAPNNLWIVEV